LTDTRRVDDSRVRGMFEGSKKEMKGFQKRRNERVSRGVKEGFKDLKNIMF